MSALLVKQLKQNEEDFEFYPSTTEILTALYWDLLPQKREDSFEDNFFGVNKNITLLDIGAGNCKLLSVFKDMHLLNHFLMRFIMKKFIELMK